MRENQNSFSSIGVPSAGDSDEHESVGRFRDLTGWFAWRMKFQLVMIFAEIINTNSATLIQSFQIHPEITLTT